MGEIRGRGGIEEMVCSIRVDLISCMSLVRIIFGTKNRKRIKRI